MMSIIKIKRRYLYEMLLTEDIEIINPKRPVEFKYTHVKHKGYLTGIIDGKDVYKLAYTTIFEEVKDLIPCCKIEDKPALVFDGETDPAMRGFGIHTSGLTYLSAYLKTQGCMIAYARLDPKNPGAIKSISNAGYVVKGIIYNISIFGKRRKCLYVRS